MKTYGFDTILTENILKIPENYFIPGNVKVVLIYDDDKNIVNESEVLDVYDKIMKDYKITYEELAK